MTNFKHLLTAVIAVAMISSLAAVQATTISAESKEKKLNANTQASQITIAVADTETEQATAVAETVSAPAADDENGYFRLGYVMLTSGTLDVHEFPSYESTVTASLNACDQVEILENSEGWYRIHMGDVVGYVPASSITVNREDADYAAMQYDNYKLAKISANSAVNVRSAASEGSDIITQLDPGTQVTLLWTEDNFIRIAYGDDCSEGYMIDTALEITGDWVEKSTVSAKQREAAEKAAAEQAAREAAEAAEKSNSSASSSNTSGGGSPAASTKGQAIVNTAMQYLGVPYVWGGTSPSGFDCSGLVQYACSANGISVARVAADQRNCGTYVSRENLQPGDLVFFGSGGNISHVGIYVGDGNMIHAPHTGDVVKISSINTSYRISQYAGAVRVY